VTRDGSLLIPAVLVWLLLAAAMFANGTLRVLVFQPRLGEHLARQVATGTGLLVVFTFALVLVRRLESPSSADLLKVGVLWLVLTLVFEFGMGTLSGASWETMLADYDILHGRLWPLIPVSALIAPWFWGAVGAAGRP
jgi:hypothetical protein